MGLILAIVLALIFLGLLGYALVTEGPRLAKELWLRMTGH